MASNKKNLLKIGDVYYLRYKVNGKQIKKSLKTGILSEAEKKRKELLHSARDVKTESDVIQKVARAKNLYNPNKLLLDLALSMFFKTAPMQKLKEHTLKDYQYKINDFLKWLSLHSKSLIASQGGDLKI